MPGGSKKGGGLKYVPFKMKGNPMKRNFGIGETEAPDKTSPVSKKGLWESLTGKKFRETKFATETKLGKDIVASGDQIGADLTRLHEVLQEGEATTPRKPAPKSQKSKNIHEKRKSKKKKSKSGKVDWSTAPKNNTQARKDWYTKHNLKHDDTTVVK